MKEKILIVTPYLSGRGGTETVLSKILSKNEFTDSYEVELLIFGGTAKKDWLSNLNCVCHSIEGNFIQKMSKLINFMLKHSMDKVICLSTKQIYFMNKFRQLFKRQYKIISWIHFSLFDESTVKTKYLKFADAHLAISSGIGNQLESLGIKKDRIKVIYNPIEKKDFTVNLIDNPGSLELMYVGRITFEGQKNIRELLDSISEMPNHSVTIHFYGEGEISECKLYIQKNNIKQNFIWHGWVNNPFKDIKMISALIMTSNYEGFPMVLLEAISYGIPVIASDCPTGPKDIIKVDNGFLYAMGNQDELRGILTEFNSDIFEQTKVKNSIKKFYFKNYLGSFLEMLNEL
ncbi:hypothetical protein A4W87_02075 [Latilactobacillus sakei]|uniref:glycosyltransferase n=1 Tax=Latilactobacillus sakei TaxID=1599 RepID=UPI000975428E|nr:glycosyltransferase [Latilactobacillus sakei]USG03721.1 hypothetical protein A4W87_02075 [Latilactobacillus sakei]